jgi:DNA-binding beta-propeller fold protein YncE
MKGKTSLLIAALPLSLLVFTSAISPITDSSNKFATAPVIRHYLYVATPGIRDYLGYGGHGILVFDMDNHHRFVKRIATSGYHPDKTPSNVKGIAVSIPLNSVFISTIESLQRIDLTTDKIIWEKPFEGGCDRMDISPDGKTMYLPSFENSFWNVVDCATGDLIKKIPVNKRAHNTIYGPSGKYVYLDDIASSWLYVVDTKMREITKKIGPFSNFIRPFTINGKETLVYATVDSLLGFEVGDLQTGKKLSHVEVQGWEAGPVRRHGDPSHGIALTPDEKEIWLADGHNMRVHVFSAIAPYQQLTTIPLQDMPGWINFSIDGRYAYPSSGEVIDTKTRKILTTLQDEFHNSVASEKMLEIDFTGNKAVKAADQFGIGAVR